LPTGNPIPPPKTKLKAVDVTSTLMPVSADTPPPSPLTFAVELNARAGPAKTKGLTPEPFSGIKSFKRTGISTYLI
jgi:hypothetical protein